MDVQDINIKSITPYENNAKEHPDDQVEQIAKSIEKFGWAQPLAIDSDGVIVIGHGRYEAAKRLGLDTVPCVTIDDLTDDEIRMLRLADNKLNESDWDFDKLTEELEGLDFGDLDLDWGIDPDETQEVTEDDFDEEPPEEPKSKRGDVYQLGRHRLMCGDSTDPEDVRKLLGVADIDMVFTDPPYGIEVVSDNGEVGAHLGIAEKGIYDKVIADDTTDTAEEFYNTSIADGLDRFIIWGGNYFTQFLPFSDGWIIWDKRCDSGIRNTFADGEMAWCSFHTPLRIYRQLWNGMIREGEHDKRAHPTQKPVMVLGNILQDFTKDGENIYDGFSGSGSTLIACEQLDRTCYMMELEPKYIDIIIDRWEKFTGQKAVKVA